MINYQLFACSFIKKSYFCNPNPHKMSQNNKLHILSLFLLLTGCITLSAQNVSSDSILIDYFEDLDVPTTYHNKVHLLKSGNDKFIDLFEHIRQAKHHIHLEYFNFRNDSIARAVFALLGEKAKEGVKVRAMFDAFGNMSNNRPLKEEHLAAIRAKGIEIVKYDPIRFPWVNHIFNRDHRKIVVIDGKIGYTGGMNIADYYIEGLPEIGEWRDMHVRIEGEAVSYLQDIFLTIWNASTGQEVEGSEYFPFVFNKNYDRRDNIGVAIVDRAPRKSNKIMRQAYIHSLDAAKNKVQIINPYFVPTNSIKQAIKRTLKRGVEVEIMIPGASDIPFTPDAAMYTVNSLRKKGANVYIYNNGFHHSKIMMVDSLFCTVGSTNLNSRSLRFDYEVNAFIFNRETTDELIQMFEEDKKNSIYLTRDIYMKQTIWKRFVAWFAHLFTPVL